MPLESRASEIAAWWGAAIATLVLVWDIWKWRRTGPRLRVSANPNMSFVDPFARKMKEESYIAVTVENAGDRTTELTHVIGKWYPSFWHYLIGRGLQQFTVIDNPFGPQLPYRIDVGSTWNGGLDQKDMIEKFGTTGFLMCGVRDSVTGKETLVSLEYKNVAI